MQHAYKEAFIELLVGSKSSLGLSHWLTATFANAVWWKFVSLKTVAPKGALSVETPTMAAHRLVCTLIYICRQEEHMRVVCSEVRIQQLLLKDF